MVLADPVGTILRLLKICAAPIRLSEHDVTCRREGDAVARRLDVSNEEPTIRVVLKSFNGSVPVP